jgi:hypothetical protein
MRAVKTSASMACRAAGGEWRTILRSPRARRRRPVPAPVVRRRDRQAGGWGMRDRRRDGVPDQGLHAPGVRRSTSSRSSLLGLKKGILFGGTSTRVPVLGLRPMRPRLWRVWKLPNPRISTLSPDRGARTMLSNMMQTRASDSFRGIPMARQTSSLRSTLVIWCTRVASRKRASQRYLVLAPPLRFSVQRRTSEFAVPAGEDL